MWNRRFAGIPVTGWAVAMTLAAVGGPAGSAAPGPTEDLENSAKTLVVEAKVLERHDTWDRRTNPLMGRPDILTEISLVVSVIGVRKGTLPRTYWERLEVIFKRDAVRFGNRAGVGWTGVLHLRGDTPPFTGLGFEPLTGPPPAPPVVKPVPVRPAPPPLPFPEGLRARDVQADADLRLRAVRTIAKRYQMSSAEAIFLTSFSGPMPPDGGYQYWGVKGKIRGRWFVWQPGKGKPFPGEELDDPHRYQK